MLPGRTAVPGRFGRGGATLGMRGLVALLLLEAIAAAAAAAAADGESRICWWMAMWVRDWIRLCEVCA
jgi:hypothetical protein